MMEHLCCFHLQCTIGLLPDAAFRWGADVVLDKGSLPGLRGKDVLILLLQLQEILLLHQDGLQVLLNWLSRTLNRGKERCKESGARLYLSLQQVYVICLDVRSLTKLLQVGVHGTYLLHDGKGSLRADQKFAGGAGDKKEDLIARLKFMRLSCFIECAPLLFLHHEHVLAHNGGNSVDPLLHLPNLSHHEVIQGWLIFPCLSCGI